MTRTVHPPSDQARDYERVARAIAFLDRAAVARPGAAPSLDEVARHVGLSPFHFQRLFRRWAGVSPKRFLQHAAAMRARDALFESASVLDAAFAAGLSGPGRLHDLCLAVDALTPGEIRGRGAGVELVHGVGATPFGDALVATSPRGLVALEFTDGDEREPMQRLAATFPAARLSRDDAAAAATLRRVFAPRRGDGPLTLHLAGTNFQVQVWRALLTIQAGRTTTYSALAEHLGRSGSARAVGHAVASNRIAWLIPCHRVLASTGALHGYRGGIDRKRVMLARERASSEVRANANGQRG